MNKKAVELRTIVIPLILLVIFLGIVFLSSQNALGGLKNKWKTIRPTFTNDAGPNPEPERFRYDFQTDAVEFFDGNEWKTFTEIPLNEKNFSSVQVKEDFTKSYYFNSSLRKSNSKITLQENILNAILPDQKQEIINSNPQAWPLNLCLLWVEITSTSLEGPKTLATKDNPTGRVQYIQTERGDVVMKLVDGSRDNCGGPTYGEITLSKTGKVYIKKLKNVGETSLKINRKLISDSATLKEITDIAIPWRDSILSTPITLNFKIGDKKYSAKSCVEKFDNRYLVADLIRNKPTGNTC